MMQAVRRVQALFFPPDPGGLRLLAALRATLAGVLAFAVVLLLGQVLPLPIPDRILAFAIALFIGVTVRDATPRGRLVTFLLAPLAAFASTTVTTLAAVVPLLDAALVPAFMFVAAWGNARAPRWGALGMVGLIACLFAMVAHQPAETLPLRFLVLVVAGASVVLVRGVLLPERPAQELARLRRAIDAELDQVLDAIAAALPTGWTEARKQALANAVYRLSDTVLLAQLRVATLAPQVPDQAHLWIHLLTITLGVERMARSAVQDPGRAEEREALAGAVAALRRRAPLPPVPETPFGSSLVLLDHLLRDPPHPIAAPPAAPLPPAPASLRAAIQTAIAGGLASIGGELVSPNRWYWAAFAAFVMFQGTRSRAESVTKGVQFILGTAAGVVAGTLLAALVSDHELLSVVMIVGAVFLAFQANVASYTVMVFWITIIIGLLFGMLGFFAPVLLLLRLEEALVGAACGAAVACLVLARPEAAVTRQAAADALTALGASVDAAAAALLEGKQDPHLSALVLTSEQRVRELHAVAQTTWFGRGVQPDPIRRMAVLLEACEQWARELGRLALEPPPRAEAESGADDPARAAIAATRARIAVALPESITRIRTSARLLDPAADPVIALGPVREDTRLQRDGRLMLRIEAALLHVATR
ncbi:MAG: FUSC family protein [Rhodospirillales bacterium]|nr:FUSC family protein [Rhodospirillales bacterium]